MVTGTLEHFAHTRATSFLWSPLFYEHELALPTRSSETSEDQEAMEKKYRLIGADGKQFYSTIPGEIGGSRPKKIYGTLDCKTALRAIANGGYVKNRVFFLNREAAIS